MNIKFKWVKEARRFWFQATDKGERPLIGFCQFNVQILDVNDNAPQFHRAFYETSISRNVNVG